MAKAISVSFRDPKKPDEIIVTKVKVEATLNALTVATRQACEEEARGKYTHFAMELNDVWSVWEMRAMKFGFMLKHFPTRDAAEMWMLHCG